MRLIRCAPTVFLVLTLGVVSVMLRPLVPARHAALAVASGGVLQQASRALPAARLAAPSNLGATADDRSAILNWNRDTYGHCASPDGVAGYRVQWGPAGSRLTKAVLTPNCTIQLQPLVNGRPYNAIITPIDSDGNLGHASPRVTFTGDGRRVAYLRKQMTGFFDDFTQPAGAFDELKWNTAYGSCNNPDRSGTFINAQFHAHNMVDDQGCDHGQTASRPRAVFDFTNRTGTVAWDMDGLTDFGEWYLDFTPRPYDVSAHVFSVSGVSAPFNTLRLAQFGNGARLEWYDGQGRLTTLAKTDWQLGTNGHETIPNVQRHWILHLSRTHVTVTVNGDKLLDSAIGLPFEKAYVLWSVFSYNTIKVSRAGLLLHWDNFGFDGPATATVTHNYRDADYDGGRDSVALTGWNGHGTARKTIAIPDSVTGATAARLFYTEQLCCGDVHFSPALSDSVIINGRRFSLPAPVAQPIDGFSPASMELDLPTGTLHSGANTVIFSAQRLSIQNVHAELDFARGTAPAYTQPAPSQPPTDALPDLGPGATVVKISGQATGYHGPIANGGDTKVWTVSGAVPFELSGDNSSIIDATGKYTGIARVEVLVDRKVIWEHYTTGHGQVSGVPTYHGTYVLDTTKLTNGPHDLLFRAYSPKGTMSNPDYFDAGTGGMPQDWPVHLDVKNA